MSNCNADILREQLPEAQREDRARKFIPVDIERENSPAFPAVVTNLSKHGMGGHSEGYLQPFDLITIVKKGYGRISGEVRWTEGENFGILFAEPVDVDLFNVQDENTQTLVVQQASADDVRKEFETIHPASKYPAHPAQADMRRI